MLKKPFILSRKPRMEMVPLIDCFFLILVFFIYGALSMGQQKGIAVDLAGASTGESLLKEEEITLSMDRTGALFLDQKPVSFAELPARLEQFRERVPSGLVFLNADKEVRHEWVMRALDLLRREKIAKVVFVVKPEELYAEGGTK